MTLFLSIFLSFFHAHFLTVVWGFTDLFFLSVLTLLHAVSFCIPRIYTLSDISQRGTGRPFEWIFFHTGIVNNTLSSTYIVLLFFLSFWAND